MKIVKKLVACALATATAICCIPTLASANASNNTVVTIGDINGDGVTLSDSLYIKKFLESKLSVTGEQFTAMDTNRDGMIDMTDYYYLMYALSHGINLGTTNNVYNAPYDGTERYLKHLCGSGNANSSTSYTLSRTYLTPNAIGNTAELLVDEPVDVQDNNRTPYCVLLKITDYNDVETYGSGFIVDDGVIATAAHCLYENGFVKSVTAIIKQEEYTGGNWITVTYEANAQSVHIPAEYKNSTYQDKPIYDFGLVKFGNFNCVTSGQAGFQPLGIDIDYYKAMLGVMSDSFADNTNNNITVTGFKMINSAHIRFSSVGNMISTYGENGYGFRFRSNAICLLGKSGGPAYFNSSAGNAINNTVIGINTPNVYADAYGVRIDPSLLRFYLNNGYL